MDYKEFCEHIKDEIKGFLPEQYASYDTQLHTVSKPNVGEQVGLTFVPPISGTPAPVIYLEPYYDAYLNRGMSVGRLMTQIADTAVKGIERGRSGAGGILGLVPDMADVKRLRDKISAYAAALVDDGDSIFINGSRTALSLLHYTGTKNVTVYTNNGWALDEIWPSAVTLHLTGGEIYQRDIESALHTSRATVSSTLKAMEKAGYIVRSSVEDDARLKKVTCTQKAVEAEKAAWRRIFENEAIMRRGMSDEDYETLLRLLEVVRVNLESERGRTAQEGAGSRIPDPAGKESDPT